MPETRPWSRPIDDTSMASAWAPASSNSRTSRCSETGSGVVNGLSLNGSSGKPMPIVPITAQRRPARVSSWAIHCEHEVLPLVPVTPMDSMLELGCP